MQIATELSVLVADELAGRPLSRATKRFCDIAIASFLLVCLAPILAVCALAIRLDSPGSILYRQQRVGKGGKIFTLLKFRSMYAGVDSAPHRAFVAAFIQGRADRQATGTGEVYKLVNDARITRVGRWLRRTSLDELPQLWNVLRGDMSLVGPRPPIPYELEHYQPAHLQRLGVTPGITGLWQVTGRNSTTFEEMVALDLDYIQRWSLALDWHILLKTIPVVFGRHGGH